MNDALPAPLRRLHDRLRDGAVAERAPFVLSMVLVVAIAYIAASLAWSVVAPQAPVAAMPAASAQPAQPPADPERIASRSLFGRADSVAAPAAVDAPDTRLNLTLRGIAASGSAAFARAVIAGPDGRERVYGTGAEVPGGAQVHEIHADRVILNRRGTLETLRLPQFASSGSTPAESAAQRPLQPIAVDQLRDQAATEALAEVVRPQAVMVAGQLRGYRVYPGRDRQRFAALGLRAGDLVTAINGASLTDPAQGLQAMQSLLGSGETVLTVERGDQVENVTIRATQ